MTETFELTRESCGTIKVMVAVDGFEGDEAVMLIILPGTDGDVELAATANDLRWLAKEVDRINSRYESA